jgi:preprotein translocase subunit SecG
METLVTILHVLVCIFLMLTVLLQAGKGGGMGATFGGGSSMGTVFGGSGAGNFLRRLTVAAAVVFMLTSMTLAWMATPSTDPLKKMWARSEQQETERKRAHEAATEGAAAPGDAVDGTDIAPVDDEEAVDTAEESVAPEGAPAAEGTATKPGDDTETKPAAGTDTKPAAGADTKPAAGTDTKPAAGTDTKPAAGADTKPAAGADTKPADAPETETPAAPRPAEPAAQPGATP